MLSLPGLLLPSLELFFLRSEGRASVIEIPVAQIGADIFCDESFTGVCSDYTFIRRHL